MQQTLFGWGRVTHVKTNTLRPEFLSDLQSIIQNTSQSLLAYGCGRSYGDEALNHNGTTVLTSHLNKMISFNAEQCVLICESGVTLHDIQHTFLPRGIGLITSPGTAFVSVGGAIVNDVHGKNHDRVGSFGNQVLWFDLLLASGEVIRCSRGQHDSIFFATIGGLGLTGIITTVCLQLQKQPMMVRVKNELLPTISALLSRLRRVRDQATYSVAWLDLTSNKNFGRSILSTGEPNDSSTTQMKASTPATTPISVSQRWLSIGTIFLNRFTLRLFNHFYYRRAERNPKTSSHSLQKFLYPLDALANWNHLYGKKGFYQFQCVIPDDAAEAGIIDILNTVRQSSHIPYLSVLKTLGSESEGLLSFPLRGFTLALDFPNKITNLDREPRALASEATKKNITTLLKQLEDITLKHNGKIYLAKDACLTPENFSKMYPKLAEFQAVLKQVDPHKRWQSELAKRLEV